MCLRKIAVVAGPLGCAALLVGTALAMFFFVYGGASILSRPPNYFHTIDIDTQTLTAELSAPFPGEKPPQSQYYSSFRGAQVLSISHYDGAKDLPYLVRYNHFEAELDRRIRTRSRKQELAHGRYGTVYAGTRFFYGAGRGTVRGSRLEVMLYANKAEHEPAQVVDDLPQPPPPLSAVSLVRVLRSHPEYAVVTAVYDSQGNLKRASFYGAKGGDWYFVSDAEIAEEHSLLSTLVPAALERYGLPKRFPLADYFEGQKWAWKDAAKPNPENFVNLHYDYNRWVRQDTFDAAGKRTTRYLTYVVTPEDKILEPIDRQVPFDQMWPR